MGVVTSNCTGGKSQKSFIDPNSLNETDFNRLKDGKPIFIKEGLNVKRNKHSNKLQGVPVEWAKKYKLPMQVDLTKTVITKHLPKQIRPSAQLPKSITDFIENKQSTLFSKKSNGVCLSIIDFQSKISVTSSSISNLLQISDISSSITEHEQLISLIQLEEQPLYESKKQFKLLSTDQFRKYLAKLRIQEKNPAQIYNFVQQIGKGSMCKVYLAQSKLNQKIKYAVKIIKLDQQRTLEKLKNQIAAMEMCYSQNIIDYSFTFLYKNSLFIFMEFMSYGNLTRFISYFNSLKKPIPEGIIAYITFQILKGLGCIHSRWQIHRDIKSDNILINDDGSVKISDFGYALQFTKEKTSCRDVVGTPAWMAPELITKKQYNQSADIWSLGIILTELVNGEPKYLRLKPLKAMYMIVSEDPPELPDRVSFDLKLFARKCLQKNPEKRATIKELLNDPFIRNVASYPKEKIKFTKMLEESQQMNRKR